MDNLRAQYKKRSNESRMDPDKNGKKIEPKINKDVYDILLPEKSISNKKSYGGTSKSNVRKMISQSKKLLAKI